MKKTFTINLAGVPFIIDEDAYQVLHSYLENIKQKFNSNEEAAEILHDIEARFAELFTEYLKGNKEVVGVAEVEAATTTMGKPEDIAGTDNATEQQNNTQDKTINQPKQQRKLFRNPDDKVLGGVLSGVSIYFGIEDSIWLRILFVALFFFGLGSTFLIYIILWAIVPEAKTASEKLQMRGESVTLDNIQREVSDAANRIGKWTNNGSIGEKLLHIVLLIFKGFLKVIALFIALIVMFVVFTFVASSVGFLSFASIPSVQELANVFAENTTVVYAAIIGVLLVVLAPLIALLYAAIRIIVGAKTRIPAMKWFVSGGFIFGILLLVFAGLSFGLNFKNHSSASQKFPLMQPANNTLFVQLADSSGVAFEENETEEEEDMMPIFINGENAKTKTGYKIGRPHIKLMPSKDTSFYVERFVTSKGKTKAAANQNAKAVNYNFTQTDTVLNLNTYYEVGNGGKWRSQNLYFRIAIPEGKTVRFADNIDYVPATVKDNSAYNNTLFANTTWTVKDGKVVCLDCKEELSDAMEGIDEIEEEIVDEKGNQITVNRRQVVIQSNDSDGGENEKVIIERIENRGEKKVKVVVKEVK